MMNDEGEGEGEEGDVIGYIFYIFCLCFKG